MSRGWVPTLTLLCLVAGLSIVKVDAQGDTPGTPNPLPCTCSDVDARLAFDSIVEYNCMEQFKFGSCNQSFILNAIEEVPEGYCEITCGRCDCCKAQSEVLKEWDVEEFRWAVEHSKYGMDLQSPGWEGVLLAPKDAAVKKHFQNIGLEKSKVKDDSYQQQLLDQFVGVHILPPLPRTRAVWTLPFLTPGTKLNTDVNGTTIDVLEGGSEGEVKLGLGNSSATIVHGDIYVCKGFLNVLDQVLVSSSVEKLEPKDLSNVTNTLSGTCNPEANAFYGGEVVKKGDDNIKASAGECCDSCKKERGCNIWVWCANKDGCADGNGTAYKADSCQLQYQRSVTLGSYAEAPFRGLTIPFVSGINREMAQVAATG